MSLWFCMYQKRVLGPATEEVMRELIKRGSITSLFLVFESDDGKLPTEPLWVKIGDSKFSSFLKVDVVKKVIPNEAVSKKLRTRSEIASVPKEKTRGGYRKLLNPMP